MKLLVIDDQEPVSLIVAEVAAQCGWSTANTTDSTDALNMVREEKIDVLLLDYVMPGKNGMEVIEELRNNGVRIPVILFSAFSDQIDRDKAQLLNVLSILSKPIRIGDLRKALSEAARMVQKSV